MEIKKQIIEKIGTIENEALLEDILRLIKMETENIESYKMSEEQINIVNEAIKQVEDGDIISSEDADEEVDKWLKE